MLQDFFNEATMKVVGEKLGMVEEMSGERRRKSSQRSTLSVAMISSGVGLKGAEGKRDWAKARMGERLAGVLWLGVLREEEGRVRAGLCRPRQAKE